MLIFIVKRKKEQLVVNWKNLLLDSQRLIVPSVGLDFKPELEKPPLCPFKKRGERATPLEKRERREQGGMAASSRSLSTM